MQESVLAKGQGMVVLEESLAPPGVQVFLDDKGLLLVLAINGHHTIGVTGT